MTTGSLFGGWCALKGLQPFPAAPSAIAEFVTEMAPIGMEKLWPTVCEISQEHCLRGLADPTLGPLVTLAINDIAKIDPPRSWPKAEKARFLSLPYDLQAYIAKREEKRDAEIRRAQNEAALVRQGKPSAKVKDGIQQTAAA